jgi:hypothetical protein
MQHFTSCSVWTSPHWWNANQRLAFFEGYLSAMEAAPKHELTHVSDWRWYEELRDYTANRVEKYRRRVATEGRPAPGRSSSATGPGPRLDATDGLVEVLGQ